MTREEEAQASDKRQHDATHEAALTACEAVMEWARTPGDHGGNPHCKIFVRAARRALVMAGRMAETD